MADMHQFDAGLAERYGLVEAIILRHFYYWISHNKNHDKHFYEDRTWTYGSLKGFRKTWTYLTEHSIRTALKNLIDNAVIKKGHFGNKALDRTSWYAFEDEQFFFNRYGSDSTNAFVESNKSEKQQKNGLKPNGIAFVENNKWGKSPFVENNKCIDMDSTNGLILNYISTDKGGGGIEKPQPPVFLEKNGEEEEKFPGAAAPLTIKEQRMKFSEEMKKYMGNTNKSYPEGSYQDFFMYYCEVNERTKIIRRYEDTYFSVHTKLARWWKDTKQEKKERYQKDDFVKYGGFTEGRVYSLKF